MEGSALLPATTGAAGAATVATVAISEAAATQVAAAHQTVVQAAAAFKAEPLKRNPLYNLHPFNGAFGYDVNETPDGSSPTSGMAHVAPVWGTAYIEPTQVPAMGGAARAEPPSPPAREAGEAEPASLELQPTTQQACRRTTGCLARSDFMDGGMIAPWCKVLHVLNAVGILGVLHHAAVQSASHAPGPAPISANPEDMTAGCVLRRHA